MLPSASAKRESLNKPATRAAGCTAAPISSHGSGGLPAWSLRAWRWRAAHRRGVQTQQCRSHGTGPQHPAHSIRQICESEQVSFAPRQQCRSSLASRRVPKLMPPRPSSRRPSTIGQSGACTSTLPLTVRMSACATRPAALKWSFSSCLKATNHMVTEPSAAKQGAACSTGWPTVQRCSCTFPHNLLAAQKLAQPRCPPAVNPAAHLPCGIKGQVAHIHPPAHGGALTPAAKAAARRCRGGQEGDHAKAGN